MSSALPPPRNSFASNRRNEQQSQGPASNRRNEQQSQGLNRRSLLRGALATAGLGVTATALSGCGAGVLTGLTTAGPKAKSLQYWDLFGGGDGVRMQDMLANYRKQNPSVDFKGTTFAWGNPYYTKLSLATIGTKPPDVAISHLTRMKTLQGADLLQELKTEDLERAGISPDNFNQRAWEAGLVNGKAYAIPLDTHPFVMFYNTAVCKKAGLLDSAGKLIPFKGEAAFLNAMKKAKAVTGKYGGVVALNTEIVTSWRIFQSLYAQLGGQMLADEGTKVVIDDQKALQVLDFLQGLTKAGLFPANIDYQGSITAFATGQAGFFFQGEWEISTFEDAKTPFSMTLFPHVFDQGAYAVQADSHTLVLPRRPDHDEERLDRALGFVKTLLDQSKTWAEGGHIPAWLPFRDSDEYKKMTPQSAYSSAADSAVYDPAGWYSGSGSNFENITGGAINAAISGLQSPKAALSQMHSKLEALAKTASPI
jgi:multiple sugar transport system substrate-binding protein